MFNTDTRITVPHVNSLVHTPGPGPYESHKVDNSVTYGGSLPGINLRPLSERKSRLFHFWSKDTRLANGFWPNC